LLERIEFDSFWLGSPASADAFVRREALQDHQPPNVIVYEVGEVSFELIVSIPVVALEGRFLDRAVHPLDLDISQIH